MPIRITLVFLSLFLPAAQAASGSLRELASPLKARALRSSSSNADLYKNGDARPIEPGETLVLGDLEGPGAVTHIWCTVGSQDPFFPSSLVLRIYWDGAEHPSVESPLGDFFGVGNGVFMDFTSLPVVVSSHGRSRNCFWRMPFSKRAKVTVTNESSDLRTDSFYYYLDWEKLDSLPEETPYFHAQYRQAHPAQPGDYTILETTGTGHYVGVVYSVLQTETGWFGEGDDRFYIDGEEFPSLRGTGTEDYFGDAWGFRQFSTPYLGVSLWEGYYPGDRNTAYRWHIEDPIPFNQSLKFTMEHRGSVFTEDGTNTGQFQERPDWVSSVAYWYQHPAVTFATRIPSAPDRLPPYRILNAADLVVRATPESAMVQSGPSVHFAPGIGEGVIAFTFEVEQSGMHQVRALLYRSEYGGVYQPMLDGSPMGGPLDLQQTGHDPVWENFDLHRLEAGEHTLSFVGVGDSPNKRTLAPRRNLLSMLYLSLLRLEDVEGYREVLKTHEEKGN